MKMKLRISLLRLATPLGAATALSLNVLCCPTIAAADTAADAAALFKKLDITEDGWLSGTELENGRWLPYDTNGDKEVTRAEFLAGFARQKGAVAPHKPVQPTPSAKAAPKTPKIARTPGNAPAAGSLSAGSPTSVTPGEYLCWQNSPEAGAWRRRVLGEMTIRKNNQYGGGTYGSGSFTYNASTRMMRFTGGGFDQRKNGEEWVGIFYRKGDEFKDGSGGKAYATMIIIYKRKDWEAGKFGWWIQQCDLKAEPK